MAMITRAWAVLVVAVKHLLSQMGLTLATGLGLVAAVSLIMSIPLYADGVYYRLLSTGFSAAGAPADEPGLPPFAFLFRFIGKPGSDVTWDRILPLDTYLMSEVPTEIGLPYQGAVRLFNSDNVQLFAAADAEYADSRQPLGWTSFATMSALDEHITLLEGRPPAPAGFGQDEPVEALVGEALATKLRVAGRRGVRGVRAARAERPGAAGARPYRGHLATHGSR